jgi:hypothetical protein
MAAASALYLAAEWSSVARTLAAALGAGFAIIAVGSVLALLRSSGYVLFGIWFPNGLLIVSPLAVPGWRCRIHAHPAAALLVAAGRRLAGDAVSARRPWWSKTMLGIQSLLIAVITLRAGLLLRPHGGR